jgi:hypothetical protein
MLRQDNIAGNAEDFLWHARSLESLVVEADVPDARRAILRCTGSGLVEEELLAGRVGAEECGELVAGDRLVFEERDERVCAGFRVREQTVWCWGFGVLAADEGADARA